MPPRWQTSSRSGANGDCVEVALGTTVRLRDSNDPDGPFLVTTHKHWRAFLESVKSGELEVRGDGTR
jgi:hypothetical protein